MQSRVDAFGVCFSHSTSIQSSSSPLIGPTNGLRFFFALPGAASSALRFAGLPVPGGGDCAKEGGLPTGLVGLPPASGLLARLAAFGFNFGTLGLVARFATIECPPCPATGTGDVAREPVSVLIVGTGVLDGVLVPAVAGCVPGA